MKSKTIILSKENENGRGILTIYQESELLECRLRLYNISKLNRYTKIGIYHNNEVFSANILEKNGTYTSSMVGNFDIDKDFYCALIDTSNNNNVLLSGGTYSGFFFNDNSVFEKEIEKNNPNTNLYDYKDTYIEDIIEENVENVNLNNEMKENDHNEKLCETCNKCDSCKYKEYFYSNQSENMENIENISLSSEMVENVSFNNEMKETANLKEDEITENNENDLKLDTKKLIESIKPQFKYVFENYPQDEMLNKLIKNSKFVKMSKKGNEYSEESEYSIGVIYENEEIKYICYAVRCDYNTPAPKELGEHYQWLPLDNQDPLSEGYYVVFQDAEDLKIIEI